MKHGLDAERLRDEAAARGTRVHEAIERHLSTGLAPTSMTNQPSDEATLVKGARRWLADHDVRVLAVEQTVFVPGARGFAGTADLVFVAGRDIKTIDDDGDGCRVVTIPAGVPVVGDWKTSRDVWPSHRAQLAAYASALTVEHAVILHCMPYAVIAHHVDLARGFQLFSAARSVYALLGPAPCASVTEAA
jgi:hypothetical protein